MAQNSPQTPKENERMFNLHREETNQQKEQHEPNVLENHSLGIESTLEGINLGAERVREGAPEKASESIGHTQGKTAQGAKQASKVSQDAIRQKLLEKLPTEHIMRKEIKQTLNKNIHKLMKKAKQAASSGNAFELNRIVARVRELKDVLASLAHATYEMLKNLWLKVVHGLS